MKTSELTDAALDWAVAKCEALRMGTTYVTTVKGKLFINSPLNPPGRLICFSPSTDWAQGGPIIERESICIRGTKPGFTAWVHEHRATLQGGPTQLIAAMRCYVASKLGDEVEIPEGLR